MVVQTNEGRYLIKFVHVDGAFPEPPTPTVKVQKTTIARIVDADTNEEIIQAYAYCSAKDKFNKETGRKVALTQALFWLPRQTRRLFWNAYFSR